MATAFLGTGLLGSGFVEGLLARGESVRVWNRTPAKAAPLAEKGALLQPTAAEAVKGASTVHLCLSDDAAVDGVLDSIRSHVANDAWVIDHTTVTPEGVRARYARARKDGLKFAHAPVFMAPANARAAKGIMLFSGPAADHEALRPILAPMTGELVYVGEREDLAASLKLFGNAMILTIAGGLADVFAMGRALGIETATAMGLFEKFNPANTISVRGTRMASGDYTPSFELSMARKDVRLMIETAGQEPLAVLPGLAQRMDALIAEGHGGEDVGVLAIPLGGNVKR